VLNGSAWNPEWLQYDYIGALWPRKTRAVGNGGFSLRSRKFMKAGASLHIQKPIPEDTVLCIHYGAQLEQNGIVFAPNDVAEKFSIENVGGRVWDGQFGFHDISIVDISKSGVTIKYRKPIEKEIEEPPQRTTAYVPIRKINGVPQNNPVNDDDEMFSLRPSLIVENTLNEINSILHDDYWLCFGGLWGLISNRGVVPDNDFDFCSFYGTKESLTYRQRFEAKGWTCGRVVLNDVPEADGIRYPLYMGFGKAGYPHVCLSFWYPAQDKYWFCHDEKKEVKNGDEKPLSEFHLKGIPKEFLKDFMRVEWYACNPKTTVRVPVMAGSILDLCYSKWAFRIHKYWPEGYQMDWGKYVSVNDPHWFKDINKGANSPYQVRVKSMAELKS
jgi:hypothetical protein